MIETKQVEKLKHTYNTLKQRRFKSNILKGAKSIREAALKAGYSPTSNTIYQNRRKLLQTLNEVLPIKEEEVIADFRLVKDIALSEKDLTNFSRANENLARIKGMFLDRSEVDNKTPSQVIISYGNTKPLPDDKPADAKP